MNNQTSGKNLIASNQVTYRIFLGILAISFPFILLVGGFLSGEGLQTSISAYYHTGMGDIFVGVLFVIGLALYFYEGYEKKDERISDNAVGNVAGIGAIGVALFPTGSSTAVYAPVHTAFAALFFVALTYFCWFIFSLTDDGAKESPKKGTYRACAVTMVVALALIPVVSNWLPYLKDDYYVVFGLESIAVIAFGLSWWINANTPLRKVLRAKSFKTSKIAQEPVTTPE